MLEITNGLEGPGLIYNGQILNDPEYPIEEARDQVFQLTEGEPGLILVFGLGLGYQLKALTERWPQARIAAFDPEPELLEIYRDHGVASEVSDASLHIIPEWDELIDLVTKELVHGDNPDAAALLSPGYKALFPDEASLFEGLIQRAQIRRAVIDKTLLEKKGLFLSNLAANLAEAPSIPLLTDLKGKLPAVPGFIVGSGPGLEKNVHLIHEAAKKGLILAASSALKPLANLGITPDIAVVLEGDDTSDFISFHSHDPGCVMALATASHPNHFKVPGYHRCLYHLTRGAAYLYGATDHIPQGGTSGSAAFTLGLHLGLNPLILIGQDQAFARDRMHALGTPGDMAPSDDMGEYTVAGIYGEPVRTHTGLIAALGWFEEAIRFLGDEHLETVVYNASESGAHIEGVRDMTLMEVMSRLPDLKGPRIEIAPLLDGASMPDPEEIRKDLEQTRDILEKLSWIARHDPMKATPLVTELRNSHPLLREMIEAPLPYSDPMEIKDRLYEAEALVFKMLETLG